MNFFRDRIGLLYFRMGLAVVGLISLIGCGKDSAEVVTIEDVGDPVVAPLREAWALEQTDEVLRLFREIDWTAKPLFDVASPLSLSEKDYAAAVKKARPGPGPDLMGDIQDFLKPLSREIAHAGRTAALQGESDLAEEYFEALHDFGVALTGSEFTVLVQMMGKSFIDLADEERGRLSDE